MATSIWEHFSVLPDPRVHRTKLHKLSDIITIVICAVICGAETWVDIADFGKAKEPWLRTFLELPNGICSHDTFGRVFAALEPRLLSDAFERGLPLWLADYHLEAARLARDERGQRSEDRRERREERGQRTAVRRGVEAALGGGEGADRGMRLSQAGWGD